MGGSLMYWGVFSALSTGPLVLIKSTINQHRYIKILEEHLLPYITKNNLTNFKFVQDNASCHSAKSVKIWLQSQNLSVIDWPPQIVSRFELHRESMEYHQKQGEERKSSKFASIE